AVTELGFDAANLCMFEDDGETYRVVHGKGLPPEYEEGIHPATMGMPALVHEAGSTVVVNDYAADPRGVPQLRELGFGAGVATPSPPPTLIKRMGKPLSPPWADLHDAPRVELLTRVNRNADVLAATINTLLDFSQLEAGRLDTRPEPFDLGELVRRSIDRLSSLFGGREVSLSVEGGLVVSADPRLIERVIDNLVSNAAKHTPDDAH